MIRSHRAANIQKRQADGKKASYCVCQQRLRGRMLQCELCCDYFHSEYDVMIPSRETRDVMKEWCLLLGGRVGGL